MRQTIGLTVYIIWCIMLYPIARGPQQHLIPTVQTDKPVTSVHQTLQKNVSTLPH